MNNIELIDKYSLTRWEYNPEGRDDLAKIKTLISSMDEHGFLECFPIIIGSDGKIGDGHRRLRAAQEVDSIVYVPVIRSTKSAEFIFKIMNGNRRTVTASEWLSAYLLGSNTDGIPSPVMSKINSIRKLAGEEALKYINFIGQSPDVGATLKTVLKYLGKEHDPSFGMLTLRWLCEKNQINMARAWVRRAYNNEILEECILRYKELPLI